MALPGPGWRRRTPLPERLPLELTVISRTSRHAYEDLKTLHEQLGGQLLTRRRHGFHKCQQYLD
jgi:hypothetical protein